MPLLRGKQTILLPVSPLFVRSTIFIAFLINISLGKAAELVNVLDIVLIFWFLREGRIVKQGTGFLIGIIIDLYFNTTIGLNALCYTITSAIANHISVRFLSITPKAQALLMSLTLLIKNILLSALFVLVLGKYPPLGIFVSPITSAILYPLFYRMLLAPQLRSTSSEETPI